MPVVAAAVLRYLIIAVAQLGIFTFIEKWVFPMLEKAIVEVAGWLGVSEETATDFLANEYLQAAEAVGVTAAIIMSKTPLKVADKLKFTTKGWNKRPLPSNVAAKSSAAVQGATAAAAATKSSLDNAAKWAQIALGVGGLPIGVGLLITNTIDFGAWPTSAYQSTVQNFLVKFGLEPDKDSRQPRTTSLDVFNKVYTAFLNQGTNVLADPYKRTNVPFTRDNMLDLTDRLASDILIEHGSVNTKQLITALLPLSSIQPGSVSSYVAPWQLQIATGGVSSVGYTQPATAYTPVSTSSATVAPSLATQGSGIQVFAGVVSQGTLGGKIAFVERQDDLITNTAELMDAARNNLSSWLLGIFGRFSYQIEIKSSIKTRYGGTIKGEIQRIQSGTYADGKPRYKNVTNKFAILTIFIDTLTGRPAKIAEIILGPTDAVRFMPNFADIQAAQDEITRTMTTSDVTDIKTIETATPVVVVPPAQQTQAQADAQKLAELAALQKQLAELEAQKAALQAKQQPVAPAQAAVAMLPSNKVRIGGVVYDRISFQRGAPNVVMLWSATRYGDGFFGEGRSPGGGTLGNNGFADADQTLAGVGVSAPKSTTAICYTTTLNDFYLQSGTTLPSLAYRAEKYEALGLGVKAYYAGTTEQNTKLLTALQKEKGC